MNPFKCLLFSSVLLGTLPALYPAVDITKVHFPPRSKELQISPLSGVTTMNYHNMSHLLASVLDVFQLVTAYKNELVITRNLANMTLTNRCFIPERNLSNYTTAETSHFLSCDHHMLGLLSLAVQAIIEYDKCEYIENGDSEFLTKVRSKIDAIRHAMENITETQQSSTGSDNSCGLRALSDVNIGSSRPSGCRLGSTSRYQRRSAGVREEDRSRPSRLRRPINSTPEPTTAESARNPREAGDIDPTDLSFLTLDREPRSEDATPTASSFTCPPVRDNEDLFRYLYEVWLGLYYVQVDLMQKRECLK